MFGIDPPEVVSELESYGLKVLLSDENDATGGGLKSYHYLAVKPMPPVQ